MNQSRGGADVPCLESERPAEPMTYIVRLWGEGAPEARYTSKRSAPTAVAALRNELSEMDEIQAVDLAQSRYGFVAVVTPEDHP